MSRSIKRFHVERGAIEGDSDIIERTVPTSKLKLEFSGESSVNVSSAAAVAVPKGVWIVRLATNTKVQYRPSGGTSWYDLSTAGAKLLVISDGVNVQLVSTSATAETTYLTEIR